MGTIDTASTAEPDYARAVAARDMAARELYAAELALHDARQSRVDAWIRAASDHLHTALRRHLAAQSAVEMTMRGHPAA